MPGKIKIARICKRVLVLVELLFLITITDIFAAEIDILSQTERNWLKIHGPIKYAPDPNFFPFEYLGPDAQAHGITPDLLKLIAEKLKIEIITIRCRTWDDVIEGIKRGDIDLLGTVTKTPERELYLQFSFPYLQVPVVLFVNKDNPKYSEIKNLKGKKVGVVRNYGAENWLRTNHPELELVTTPSSREGLLLLEMGQIDAFAEVLPVGVSIITENSLFSIRHSTEPLYTTPQHFAVTKTNEILLGIIEKGLAQITESEKENIFQRWSKRIPVENNRVLRIVLILSGIIAFLALLFVTVTRSLKNIIRKKTEQLRKSEEFFRGIFQNNPLPGAIIELETGKIIDVNNRFLELSGYTREEVLNKTTIASGFWINPDSRTKLVKELKLQKVLYNFEQEFRVKNNKILSMIVNGQVFDSEGKEIVLYLFEDITEKKKIELLQKRLADIVESAEAFILTTDVNLNIFYTNTAAKKRLLFNKNAKLANILRDEEKTLLENEIIPTAVKDGYWKGEMTIKASDGYIPVLATVIAHKKTDNTIDYYSFIFRDITDLKKATETLREREEKLSWIIEHSTQMFYVHDAERRIIYVSPQVKSLLGYEVNDVIGRHTSEFISDNPINSIGAELTEVAVRTGERQRPYELELTAKNGDKVWVEVNESPVVLNGQTVAITGSLTDITQRKNAERQLTEHETLLAGINRNSPDLIIVFDALKNEPIYTNKSFEQFIGIKDMQDFDLQKLTSRMPEEDADKLLKHLNRIRDGEDGIIYEIEYRVKNEDNQHIWIRARNSIFKRDESGNVIQILSIQQNITKEKKTAQEREEYQSRIHQSNKMQALGELASGVAHDVNNYLTVIKGNLSLLGYNPSITHDDQVYLKEAIESVEQIENLSRQLLVFSRREVMEVKPVNINQLIIQAQKMLRRMIRENIELILELGPNLPLIHADHSMVQTSLINLVTNARDAMPKGGTITISTKLVEIGTEVISMNPEAKSGKYIQIKVTDTGTGISKEIIERIFEPYFTTKPAGHGTGMGLSIVNGVVKQHGGWVDVESQIGKGTSFILHFPVPEKLIEVKPKTIEATSKLQGGQETILVVEDNEPVRKIAVACLRKLGYTILEASNGNTAIQLVQNYRGTIDLLFTDMIMPGNINGLDLYEKLKEKMPGLKVIFTSGHPGDVLQIKADLMASGIFLKKPFDPVALAEKVRNCLNNNQHNGIK